MIDYFLDLSYLSPTGFVGFWVLFIGLLFTGIMFYFVFFRLANNNDSYKDQKRKKLEDEEREKKVARLYPNKN